MKKTQEIWAQLQKSTWCKLSSQLW